MNNGNIHPAMPNLTDGWMKTKYRLVAIDAPKVSVYSHVGSISTTKCYIDGIEVPKVRSVDFHVAADEIPTATFEVLAMPEIDMFSDVRFDFTPKSVQEACVVLQNELSKHSDVFYGFVASVESVLKENIHPALYSGNALNEVASDIIKRISGV